MTEIFFDAERHEYRVNGVRWPSVTEIISTVFGRPGWVADEWYLERGRAVHACAALIAQGKDFEHDERIAGQVAACRKFFSDFGERLSVVAVEQIVASEEYVYAGTFDMACTLDGQDVVVDWKTQINERAKLQVGAYALARNGACASAGRGLVVVLGEDGRYRCSDIFECFDYADDFIAARRVFARWQKYNERRAEIK